MIAATKNTKTFHNTEIPEDWEVRIVENFGEVKRGAGSQYIKYCEEGGIRLIRINDFFENNAVFIEPTKDIMRFVIEKNDILFAGTGASAGASYIPKDEWQGLPHSYNAPRIRVKSDKNREFLLYALQSDYVAKQQKELFVGAAQPFLDITAIANLKIFTPKSNSEQKVIARVLSTWDEAIHTTEKLIAQKELRKKWLMQQLLTGKKRLKGFGGEWKEMHIRDVAKEVSIRNKSDKQLTVLSCTKYDGLVPSLEYFGRKIFADDISTYKIVSKNHFAYATNHIEEGSIGYQEILDEALISPMYTVFKTDKTVNDDFFYKLMKSHKLVYQYQNRMEGSIDRRGGLRWDAFSIIKIRLPSREEQTAIAQVLQAADKEISLLKAKAEKLREQKKGLMQQLLTGKVRLKINE
jgi:type I restriction enzyme, S subunit